MLTEHHIREVCQVGAGKHCCSFLVCGPGGFECSKRTPIELLIRLRRSAGTMVAKGENCSGPPEFSTEMFE
jgi:hypothetical protein